MNTSRVPVEGKSSVCLICIKYRIIILIIIIISLGQILLSYIENTSRTHDARTRIYTRTRTHTPPSLSGYHCAMGRWRPTVTARSAGDNGRRCFIQINTRECDPVSRGFVCFSRIKKLLGQTETRTCDRMCSQTIRTV